MPRVQTVSKTCSRIPLPHGAPGRTQPRLRLFGFYVFGNGFYPASNVSHWGVGVRMSAPCGIRTGMALHGGSGVANGLNSPGFRLGLGHPSNGLSALILRGFSIHLLHGLFAVFRFQDRLHHLEDHRLRLAPVGLCKFLSGLGQPIFRRTMKARTKGFSAPFAGFLLKVFRVLAC